MIHREEFLSYCSKHLGFHLSVSLNMNSQNISRGREGKALSYSSSKMSPIDTGLWSEDDDGTVEEIQRDFVLKTSRVLFMTILQDV